jgi:hypothetical protein
VGESRVAKQLNKFRGEEHVVLNDVLIRTMRGSVQIDHIVISTCGIFVIETKNYDGWIHGNENSEYWTQSIYKMKTKFRNPIKQNWAHIYALKEILSDFGQVIYHPIVVFAGDAELKNISSTVPVIYDHQIFQAIIDKRGISNLSIDQIKNITYKLNDMNIKGKKARTEHIHQVKNYIKKRHESEKSLICIRCGGSLVIREGRYGKFYGCSNYPKCKYTTSF